MTSHEPPDQYSVYLEANFIVDLAYPSGDGIKIEIDKVLDLLDKYSSGAHLRPVTSTWALIEAKGVLYGKLLEEAGVQSPSRFDYRSGRIRDVGVRNHIPPMGLDKEMKRASELIEAAVQILRDVSDGEPVIVPPDGSAFWSLVDQLATGAAIWPLDSIHIATALYEGCGMVITNDNDLLDKIEWSLHDLIHPIQKRLFSELDTISFFCAHSLWPRKSNLSEPRNVNRPSAVRVLNQLGFRK